MRSSTIVCVAGASGVVAHVLDALRANVNVAVVRGGPAPPSTPADVAVFVRETRSLYARAGARQTPYAVVDADPLAPVREAWRRRFAESIDVFEEFAGALAPHRPELPDYYVVLHPPDAGLDLEWYAGLLRDVRAARVVLVPAHAGADELARRTAHALGHLPTGPVWPPTRELVERARRFVPAAAAAAARDTPRRYP